MVVVVVVVLLKKNEKQKKLRSVGAEIDIMTDVLYYYSIER